VRADVREQIGQHLPDPSLIDDRDQPRRGLGADRAIRLHRHGVGDCVAHHDREVGLREVKRGGPVQPGQLKQLGDQRRHALRLLLDPAHRAG
jgi:hypothetical protein